MLVMFRYIMYVIWRRYSNIALKAKTRLDRYVMMQNISLGVRLRTQAFLYAQENCIWYHDAVPRNFLTNMQKTRKHESSRPSFKSKLV